MHYKYISSLWGQNQIALAITTSQRMKNGQDIIIQMEIILCDPDKINIPSFMVPAFVI